MKVNLNKAAKIRAAIEKAIPQISFAGTAEISITAEQPLQILGEAEKKLLSDMETVIRLEAILTNLRNAIGTANAGKINGLLAKRAGMLRTKAHYDGLLKTANRQKLDTDVVEKRLEIARKRAETSEYGVSDTLSFPVLTETTINTLKDSAVAYVRQIADLEEQIGEVNIKTEIDIPDGDVEFLRTNRVI